MNSLLVTTGFNRWMGKSLLVSMMALLLAGCSGKQESKPGAGLPQNPPNYGQRKTVPFEELKTNFSNPDMIYAPFIFWFWDEPLNAEKMAEMSRVMGSQGFNPGYAHARHSMIGTPSLPDSEWLGEKWFSSFSAALGEAEKQNKYLGYCDEYWWPSFQANGRVLKKYPELKAETLKWDIIDAKGGSEIKVPGSYFTVAARLTDPVEEKQPLPQLGQWIWHPDAKEIKHNCWFRYSFDIPSGRSVKMASMRITADNELALYVNGHKTAESKDWDKPLTLDLTKNLVSGSNVIALECNNRDGKYGLIAGLVISLDDGSSIGVKSDKTWMTCLQSIKDWEIPGMENKKAWKPAAELGNPGDGPWTSVTNSDPYNPATILSESITLIGSGSAFTWKVPEGDGWRIYVFNKYNHAGAADGQQCNSIDSRLADAFIGIALEPYAERFPKQIGKSIPGDFIDHEGDYGWKLAWSGSLDSSFQALHKRDIRLSMPLLLDMDKEGKYASARWKWFDLVSDLYAGNFRTITNWHEKRGMYTTAHVWEEGIQPQVNCVGDHLKILRSLTMPGQDCLGLKALRVHDFKEPQSVSEFENVRFASEVLGASDFEPGKGLWGCFTPSLLKQSVNSFTAWGVSHVIPHGVFTTRTLKGNPWPPDWYSENPMFPWLHHWTDFTRRASYINSMGNTVPDVLLYNPMESAWINANGPLLDDNGMWAFDEKYSNGKKINDIDKVYADAINDLTNARVEFLVGDRYYLKQMAVDKGQLVRGPLSFRTLVLPQLEILTLDVARKIVDFAKSGGKVFSMGTLPRASAENGMDDPRMEKLMDQLKSAATFTQCDNSLKSLLDSNAEGLLSRISFVSGAFPMVQLHRRIDGKDFFWLVNNNEQQQICDLSVKGARGAASIWDCETGKVISVSSVDQENGSSVHLVFKPLEAYWLVFDPQTPATTVQVLAEPIRLSGIEGEWKVTFDPSAQPVLEFPFKPAASFIKGVTKPLEDWGKWGLTKFSGLLDYSRSVNIDKVDGQLLLDLGKVCHVAEVWVNGQSVGSRMWGPYVFDITAAAKPGPNEIRVRVANLINNSYGDLQESGLLGPVKILEGGQEITGPGPLQAGFYTPERQGQLWDTWVYYYEGTYYQYYLAGKPGKWDCFELMTSKDGVNWHQTGRMIEPRAGTTWMGTGHIIEAPDFISQPSWIMNYSEWFGDKQDIMFATSTDLIHWTKVADSYRFIQDGRWYQPKGRWDCIDCVKKDDGSYYGYFTADPIAGKSDVPVCGFGFAESKDGLHWIALPPVPGNISGEFGGIQKIGNKYFITVSEGRIAVSEKPEGPFLAQKKNSNMFGKGCDIYFPRFFHNPPVNETNGGNGVLVNHFYTGSDHVYSSPLKAVEIDGEGILRLKWWEKNNLLKDQKLTLSRERNENPSGPVTFFKENFDTNQVGVVETDFNIDPEYNVKSLDGFYFDTGKDSGYFIIFNQKQTLFGTMNLDGSDLKTTVKIDRDLIFPANSKARLVFKKDMVEAYLNDYLVMLKRITWSGKLGIINNAGAVSPSFAWTHK